MQLFWEFIITDDSIRVKPEMKPVGPVPANRPQKKRDGMKDDCAQSPTRDDGVYYELDENEQLIREKPRPGEGRECGRGDSVYYEMDENDQLVRCKGGGRAAFSKNPGNEGAVVVEPPSRNITNSDIACKSMKFIRFYR